MSQNIDSNLNAEAARNDIWGGDPDVPKPDEETMSSSQAMPQSEHEGSYDAEVNDETNTEESVATSPPIIRWIMSLRSARTPSDSSSSSAEAEPSPPLPWPEFLSHDILRSAPLVQAPIDYWLVDHTREALSPNRIRKPVFFRVRNAATETSTRMLFKPQRFQLDSCEKPWQLLVADDLDFEKFKEVMARRVGFCQEWHSFFYVLGYDSPNTTVVMVVSDRATWIHGIKNQRGRGKRWINFYFDLTTKVVRLREEANGAVAAKATENGPKMPFDEDLFGVDSDEESNTRPRLESNEATHGGEWAFESHWTWNA